MKAIFSLTSTIFMTILASGIFLFGFQEETFKTAPSFAESKNQPEKLKPSVLLNIQPVSQLPELPRGCEVTSLAMLLQSAGITADKNMLSKQIKKDPSKKKVRNGKVYFGNPNIGFVGNMYTRSKPGYGVYNKPIYTLARKYLNGRAVNLSGQSFDAVKSFLSNRKPVWVITNTEYRKLPKEFFRTWYTRNGPIQITKKEHSVLLTGYDSKYVYFNDPLSGEKNKKAPEDDFIKSWKQMGSQAISYTD